MTHDPNAAFGDRVVHFTPREPKYEHVRRLWTFRSPKQVDVTADVYRTETGLELCVERDGEFYLTERCSSMEHVEARAAELASTLREAGFIEQRGDENTGAGAQG